VEREARAPWAVGAQDRSLRKLDQPAVPLAGDKHVARVGPLREGGDHEVPVLDQRHVLGAVHGEVDLALHQPALERSHEDALSGRDPSLAEVALGDDLNQLHLRAQPPQTAGDELALDERQP
jgi:hypothetical protein